MNYTVRLEVHKPTAAGTITSPSATRSEHHHHHHQQQQQEAAQLLQLVVVGGGGGGGGADGGVGGGDGVSRCTILAAVYAVRCVLYPSRYPISVMLITGSYGRSERLTLLFQYLTYKYFLGKQGSRDVRPRRIEEALQAQSEWSSVCGAVRVRVALSGL